MKDLCSSVLCGFVVILGMIGLAGHQMDDIDLVILVVLAGATTIAHVYDSLN